MNSFFFILPHLLIAIDCYRFAIDDEMIMTGFVDRLLGLFDVVHDDESADESSYTYTALIFFSIFCLRKISQPSWNGYPGPRPFEVFSFQILGKNPSGSW